MPELILKIISYAGGEFPAIYKYGQINRGFNGIMHGKDGMEFSNRVGLRAMKCMLRDEFRLPYLELFNILHSTSASICGGLALQTLLGMKESFTGDSDLDIYVQRKSTCFPSEYISDAERFAIFLQQNKYILRDTVLCNDQYQVDNREQHKYGVIFASNIFTIETYVRVKKNRVSGKFKSVQIMTLRNIHVEPSNAISFFDLTICQVAFIISEDKSAQFIIIHPYDVAYKRLKINNNFKENTRNLRILYSLEGNYSNELKINLKDTIISRIEKYRSRGFYGNRINFGRIINDMLN
jgi:hypothetical protein